MRVLPLHHSDPCQSCGFIFQSPAWVILGQVLSIVSCGSWTHTEGTASNQIPDLLTIMHPWRYPWRHKFCPLPNDHVCYKTYLLIDRGMATCPTIETNQRRECQYIDLIQSRFTWSCKIGTLSAMIEHFISPKQNFDDEKLHISCYTARLHENKLLTNARGHLSTWLEVVKQLKDSKKEESFVKQTIEKVLFFWWQLSTTFDIFGDSFKCLMLIENHDNMYSMSFVKCQSFFIPVNCLGQQVKWDSLF